MSSFETMFGFKHRDHDGIKFFEEMRKSRTVAERLALSSKHTEFFKIMKSNKDWVYIDTKGIPEENDGRPLWPDIEELPTDIDLTTEAEEDLGGFPPGGFYKDDVKIDSPKATEEKTF